MSSLLAADWQLATYFLTIFQGRVGQGTVSLSRVPREVPGIWVWVRELYKTYLRFVYRYESGTQPTRDIFGVPGAVQNLPRIWVRVREP